MVAAARAAAELVPSSPPAPATANRLPAAPGSAGALEALAEDAPAEGGLAADEWFVGIKGVPTGPIKLSELRERAGRGEIKLDSLVWRDGLEEWKPLRSYPELTAVVEECLSNVRASAAPFAKTKPTPPALPAVKADIVADPFATPAPAPTSSSAVTGSALVTEDLAAAGLVRPRSPIAAWAAVVVALLLGLTIGFVLFSQQKEPERIVQYVPVAGEGTASANAAPAEAMPVAAAVEAPAAATETRKVGAGSGAKSSTAAAAPKPEATEAAPLSGLKGLSGLSAPGPEGPSGTGTSSTSSSAGGQLDSGQIEGTVARYKASVKRSCWQPALDARDPSAPTSARVNVTIAVAPSGAVQNVTTSGDPKGYAGLSSCIAGRVRGWQFPSSGSSTTVNVPFVFAAQ